MSLVDNGSRVTSIEGYSPRTDEDMLFLYNVVAPDYFGTLRIPLLSGRDFARTDDDGAQAAVIVNETLARRFWETPDNAVGKRLRSGTNEWRNVIGVVRDLKYSRLSEGPRPFVYYPLLQTYVPGLTIHARAAGDLNHTMRRVRDHVQALDPTIPITRSTTLTDQTRVALSVYELAAGALTMFGVMTIVLAAIGIYGLVAYTVQQSTQEIGIRMAVGAQRRDVAWSFLGHGVKLAAIGAVIGLVIATLMSGAIGSLLYGTSARDLVAFAGGTGVVMGVALIASFFPAWKASRIDPLTALRHRLGRSNLPLGRFLKRRDDVAMNTFTAIVERDADTGLYVGWVPGLAGAHSQGATVDELRANLREVLEMLVEDGAPRRTSEFVGTEIFQVR